jgi:polyhydroxyalkanoate depolymerase
MLYKAYQTQTDMMSSVRAFAELSAHAIRALPPSFAEHVLFRNLTAGSEMLARAGLTHERPPFGIETVMVGNAEVPVHEEPALVTPFGTVLHFAKAIDAPQPRVLVVAPLSGHFATLLRETVRTLLPEHDVYLTDWHNARDIPLAEGRFGFDEYIDHVIRFLQHIGPGAHLVAVCQPCVAGLAATAVMAEAGDPCTPRSLTLIAGPIDTRINPTTVNELATGRPIGWFECNFISKVPGRYPAAGRRVYPGFLQLTAFMSMNLDRHVRSHSELYANLANGDIAKAGATKTFYDEYFAVLDLTAEFYLETVERIFQQHLLARGLLEYQGRLVDPRAIKRTSMLTVEGERDDICSAGQTLAAHDLCRSIKPYRKRHHLQPGVGHYGVFSGRRWQSQIYPLVRNTILSSD